MHILLAGDVEAHGIFPFQLSFLGKEIKEKLMTFEFNYCMWIVENMNSDLGALVINQIRMVWTLYLIDSYMTFILDD